MGRSTARVAVCLALVGLMSPSRIDARAVAPAMSRFMLVRTTSGPSWYELSLGASALQDRPAFIGFVSTLASGVRIAKVGHASTNSLYTEDPVDAGAAGYKTSLCDRSNHQFQLCWAQGGPGSVSGLMFLLATYNSGASSKGDDNLVFIVTQGVTVGETFRSKGWKLVRLPIAYRTNDVTSASLLRANVDLVGADVFTSTRAWGGRYGSIAVATPPCSYVGVGVGVGSFSLAGGANPVSAICPLIEADSIAMSAPRSTTWNFSGLVAGVNLLSKNRLFVLDLPKTLPRTAA